MNTTGWWAVTTTPARNSTWISITTMGTRTTSASGSTLRRTSSRCRISVTARALKNTAMAARQPKFISMKLMSQFHLAATISTGGAANGVSTPPMEILTNRTPNVAYLSMLLTLWRKMVSRNISAPRVMAAGSVIKEPSSGTKDSSTKYIAMVRGSGISRASACTPAVAMSRIGRVAATTMITNTNIGSVKLRDSTYSSACCGPVRISMTTTMTMAQKPNTTSTSPSRCQTPPWRGFLRARSWKNLVEKVCSSARAKMQAATICTVEGLRVSIGSTKLRVAARPAQDKPVRHPMCQTPN